MTGQSMINFRSIGGTRLSTLASGVFLLVLILALGDLFAQIPMAALVAVMIMVSIGTFDWRAGRQRSAVACTSMPPRGRCVRVTLTHLGSAVDMISPAISAASASANTVRSRKPQR